MSCVLYIMRLQTEMLCIQELPENEMYCPPISIRCVDCRSFGRFVLVGTHVISNIHKFMFVPTTKKAKNVLQKLFPGEFALQSSVKSILLTHHHHQNARSNNVGIRSTASSSKLQMLIINLLRHVLLCAVL